VPYKMNIEELLVEHGYLTRSQLERAMYFKEQEPGKTAEQILVELGYVTEEAVMECAAVRDHLQVTDLDSYKIDLKAADMVSPGFAGHNRIIPIDFEESRLVVAASYPIDMDVIDETATLTGMEVKVVLGSSAAVGRAIDRSYENTPGGNHGFMNRAFGTSGAGITDNRNRQMELVLKERVEGAPVVRMVNAIIEEAYNRNASDIHVEPGNHELVIRMRINGDLIVHTTLEMEYHRPMITRLKLMAGMDIAEKRLPQDGKYHYERADVSTDLRISTLPSVFGEKVVLRLLGNDRDNSLMDVSRLGMTEAQREIFERILKVPHGIVLVTGPTGSGKTYLVKTLARLLDVPLAITDATSLTEAGYIGDDIESVVSKLLAAADNDVERAEHGIIFIDEIDKIAKKRNTNQRDVSGESVQQGMLKLLEGAEVEVPVGASSKNAMVPMTMVNTKNILFICGGAFPELEEIIKERLNQEASIGFRAKLKDEYDKDENLLSKVTVEDVRKFGMIPEFLGRLPILFTLEPLSEDTLVRILQEPKNAILKQYEKLLAMDEVKLAFDEDALRAIAHKAKEKKVGARALRAVIEEFMLDIMYEIPKDDNIGMVTITKDYVEKKGSPVITLRGCIGIGSTENPQIAASN